MKSFVIALLLACAPVYGQDPKPVDPPKAETKVSAKLEYFGPKPDKNGYIKSGRAFAIYYDITEKGADGKTPTKVTWNNSYPEGAVPPMKGKGENDRPMFTFFDSVEGTYTLTVEVQYPSIDPPLDPFARETITVKVGAAPPEKPVIVVPDVPKPAEPSADLKALVDPFRSVLAAGDQSKKPLLASVVNDFYNVVKTSPIATTGVFQDSLVSFLDAAAESAGLVGAFPGFSTALDTAMKKQLGTEDVALDKQKSLDFLAALVWVCSQ